MQSLAGRGGISNDALLEILTFKVGTQILGVNVFKVKEIVRIGESETFASLPHSHPYIEGIKKVRESVIPVFNAKKSLSIVGKERGSYLLIIEVSNVSRGLLVDDVSKIERFQWNDLEPAPKSLGKSSYISSVIKANGKVLPILDFESLFDSVNAPTLPTMSSSSVGKGRHVLIVDDSLVAYNQIAKCAKLLGFDTYRCTDGQEALSHIECMVEKGIDVSKHYSLSIIDIEMPKMDGLSLVKALKRHSSTSSMNIMINSSLSDNVSVSKAKDVGADMFLNKFNPDLIQSALTESVGSEQSHISLKIRNPLCVAA